jgi:predicted DNA-binding transcriptional regulator YafY
MFKRYTVPMQASRLLSILMLLQARGRMAAPALAQTLEVSERTILRDIDQLSAAGVPIWGERGRNGGFQLRAGWSTTLTGVTAPEAQALFLAGLPEAATELGLGSAAGSARLKIIASLPPEWRVQADQVASRLHIDAREWYRAADAPRFLREAAHAVWRAERIAVKYESWRGVARRELEPLGLVLKAGTWYLIAHVVRNTINKVAAASAPLTFRLSNLQNFEATGRPFKRPRHFDLAAHWQASTLAFERGLQRLTARVAVSPRGEKWLANDRAPATRVSASNAAGQGAWNEYLLPIESIEQGARQLLGFGAEIKVLSPTSLRDALSAELQRSLALYQ